MKARKLKEKYATINQQNLQLLMIKIFKEKNNINSAVIKYISTQRDVQYNLRNKNHLQVPNVKAAKYRIENIQ